MLKRIPALTTALCFSIMSLMLWGSSPRALAQQAPVPCSVAVDKTAAPAELLIGETVDVRLAVDGACPTVRKKADVMMVIDRSSSMTRSGKLDAARAAALVVVDALDLSLNRIGVVVFDAEASLLVPLTDDRDRLVRAINGINWVSGTNLVDSYRLAFEELTGPNSRVDAQPAMLFMTDGAHSVADPPLSEIDPIIDQVQAEGVQVYTIGLGAQADRDLLIRMAGDPSHHFESPDADDLARIFGEIAEIIEAEVLFRSIVVEDIVPANMRYIEGSAQPAVEWLPAARMLRWRLSSVPESGFQLTYRLEPMEAGVHPTNVVAEARYEDGFGNDGTALFPVPEVEVIRPSVVYLPFLSDRKCLRRLPLDVVLVIDTSSSMRQLTGNGATKLEAAVSAAARFADLLAMPVDRVGVVGFNSVAWRASELTGDTRQVKTGLQGLVSDIGTRIDRGLTEGRQTLVSGRRPAALPVVVLLTDGFQSGVAVEDVQAAARELKATGAIVYTIGLGSQVQVDLLREVASEPSGFYSSPRAEDLEGIYEQIRKRVECSGG